MNIQDLAPFKNIDPKYIELIVKNSEFLKYKIGQPIIPLKTIPNKIMLLCEGNARLLGIQAGKRVTITKLGIGSFLGISSLLTANGCEEINASDEVKVIAIDDQLIINMYTEEKSFRNYCDKNRFPGELLYISNYLVNLSNSLS